MIAADTSGQGNGKMKNTDGSGDNSIAKAQGWNYGFKDPQFRWPVWIEIPVAAQTSLFSTRPVEQLCVLSLSLHWHDHDKVAALRAM